MAQDILEVMRARHSVRSYSSIPLSEDVVAQLKAAVERCNADGDLTAELVVNEPEAFDSTLAHYGNFSGISNYIVMKGQKNKDLEERCGYYGEELVLLAQELGLNTCWVGLTFKRRHVRKLLAKGEKMVVVIALGYGTTQGAPHKSKPAGDLANALKDAPEWYLRGVEAAMLAPTAVNQQKFEIVRNDTKVAINDKGGPMSKIDLGIVKHDFEAAAGKENFTWA